ncbi:putative RING-H2 finger protein ATL69 [Zootermopsis nevadensis]|uniref:putative RING-H2 finger protein ATL69 n=1 Tax=Zootermopsis nevadensis TaxID=136037 RepID=UPI000B8EB1C9|nr:putative RING-H2 finger protein ATL69 [Zootermopsis nevadensis]
MPYPGIALGFLLGVGVAVAAMVYFLSQTDTERPHHNYHNNNRSPSREPGKNQRGSNGNSRPGCTTNSSRRRRKQSPKEEVTRCVICYEELTNYITTLSCQHRFHFHCIREWFKESETCPMCRKTAAE